MNRLVMLTFVYLILEDTKSRASEDTKSRALTHEVPPHVDSSSIASEVSVFSLADYLHSMIAKHLYILYGRIQAGCRQTCLNRIHVYVVYHTHTHTQRLW